MKRNIKITLSLICLFVSLGLTAQTNNQTTMQKLINKDWVTSCDRINGGCIYKERYTTTYIIESLTYQGKTNTSSSYFYLSNQIETSFDNSKVGNVADGKYIMSITEIRGRSVFHVFEIIELNTTFMKLKSLKSGVIFEYNVQ